EVPTILTTVAEKSFSGPIFPEIQAVFPNQKAIDRTTMNTWEDKRVTDQVNKYGKNKIVIAALWTEVCGVMPVLSAIDQGYEVYFVTDASGGVSDDAHNMAVQRMVNAGAI
ncbi:isochorismatase family protein, partial [Vibrio breoganii]